MLHLPSAVSISFKGGRFEYACIPCQRQFFSHRSLREHSALHASPNSTCHNPSSQSPPSPPPNHSDVANQINERSQPLKVGAKKENIDDDDDDSGGGDHCTDNPSIHGDHNQIRPSNTSTEKKESPPFSDYLSCDYCDAVFRYPNSHAKHVKLHESGSLEITPTFRTCGLDGCRKEVRNHYALFRHQDDVHEGGDFVCRLCDQIYTKRSHLYLHELKTCAKNPRASKHATMARAYRVDRVDKTRPKKISKRRQLDVRKCDNCGKTFGDRQGLLLHLKNKTCFVGYEKESGRPATCHLCGQSFAWIELQTHVIRDHEIKNELKCELCDPPKTFRNGTELKTHNRTTHDKSFCHVCDQCGLCFQDKASLRNHLTLREVAGCRTLLRSHLTIKTTDTTQTYMNRLMPMLLEGKRYALAEFFEGELYGKEKKIKDRKKKKDGENG